MGAGAGPIADACPPYTGSFGLGWLKLPSKFSPGARSAPRCGRRRSNKARKGSIDDEPGEGGALASSASFDAAAWSSLRSESGRVSAFASASVSKPWRAPDSDRRASSVDAPSRVAFRRFVMVVRKISASGAPAWLPSGGRPACCVADGKAYNAPSTMDSASTTARGPSPMRRRSDLEIMIAARPLHSEPQPTALHVRGLEDFLERRRSLSPSARLLDVHDRSNLGGDDQLPPSRGCGNPRTSTSSPPPPICWRFHEIPESRAPPNRSGPRPRGRPAWRPVCSSFFSRFRTSAFSRTHSR